MTVRGLTNDTHLVHKGNNRLEKEELILEMRHQVLEPYETKEFEQPCETHNL